MITHSRARDKFENAARREALRSIFHAGCAGFAGPVVRRAAPGFLISLVTELSRC